MTIAIRRSNGEQILFDAVTRFSLSHVGTVSENPVERKASVSDHFTHNNPEIRISAVLSNAEYHTNRNFVLRGYSPLNEFYEFLGLPQTADGEKLGWTCTDGECWIDFEHRPFTNNRGTQCYELTSMSPPDDDYMRDWT